MFQIKCIILLWFLSVQAALRPSLYLEPSVYAVKYQIMSKSLIVVADTLAATASD